MDRMLGSPDYWRVRLGIGHPGDKARVLGWVLGDFAKADAEWLNRLLSAVSDARRRCWPTRKPEEFMSLVSVLSAE